MSDDLIDRLRLVRSPGIGPVTYRQLIARFGTASAALGAIPDLAARGGGKPPRLAGRDQAQREVERVEKLGARYLLLRQGLYPRLLAELDDAPPVLIANGDLNLLDRPLVAMVGARNASAAACRFARSLASELGGQGRWWSLALPAASTAPPTTERWKPARSASSQAESTSSIRPRTRRGRRGCSSADW